MSISRIQANQVSKRHQLSVQSIGESNKKDDVKDKNFMGNLPAERALGVL